MTCLLNGPLHIVKNHIILLTPYNPQKSTSQKELDVLKPFKCIAHRLIKHTLHHREGLHHAELFLFGKELPNDVGNVSPPMWS